MIPGKWVRSTAALGWLLASLATLVLLPSLAAAPPPTASGAIAWKWHDARDVGVEGRGWTDTKDFFDRLPGRAEGQVRPDVWNLSHDSAGLCLRFETDATTMAARWKLRRSNLAMSHMPATGVSGVDLYVREQGRWHWLANGRPEKASEERILVQGLKPGRREYLLYLPLYNGVESVSLGVPADASFSPSAARVAGRRPIVFYGSSIVQGGCASRPGMAYPAILGRRLDQPAINLGFSGNALSEPEIARFFAELDPSVYVLDPLPNMSAAMVAERVEPFIRTLRAAHPHTPIILVEHIEYADALFLASRREKYVSANVRLREVYQRLLKSGQRKLYYVPAAALLGPDGEATVDGTHPTDLGFQRMADAIEPMLRRALKAGR